MPLDYCTRCDSEATLEVAGERPYPGSGLDNIILRDVQIRVCKCGESLLLKAAPTLQKVIAVCLAFKPVLLSGSEIRAMRSILRLKSKDLAEKLGVGPEHLSRIENGHEPISPQLDKLIRLRVALEFLESEDHVFRELFSTESLLKAIDEKRDEDQGNLELHISYRGPYSSAETDPLEFTFEQAA